MYCLSWRFSTLIDYYSKFSRSMTYFTVTEPIKQVWALAIKVRAKGSCAYDFQHNFISHLIRGIRIPYCQKTNSNFAERALIILVLQQKSNWVRLKRCKKIILFVFFVEANKSAFKRRSIYNHAVFIKGNRCLYTHDERNKMIFKLRPISLIAEDG